MTRFCWDLKIRAVRKDLVDLEILCNMIIWLAKIGVDTEKNKPSKVEIFIYLTKLFNPFLA